jgi:hypothetical protein
MADIKYPGHSATADKIARGKKTVVRFIANAPVWCGTTYKMKNQVMLENITDMPEMAFSAANERELYNVGFKKITINDGGSFTGSFQFEGASRSEVLFMIGRRPTTSGAEFSEIPLGVIYNKVGHLVWDVFNDSGEHIVCNYLLDVDIKLYQIPGASDSDNPFTVEIVGTDSRAGTLVNSTISAEFWGDFNVESTADGNTVLDGTETDFVLGTGNRSFATSTTPVAKKLDQTKYGTTLANYFIALRLSGSNVLDTEAAFTVGTSTIAFGTAPTTSQVITAIYATAKDTVAHTDSVSNFFNQRASTLMGV